ncbi:MAG: hypothetical protein HY984_01980, partial [Candidatus Magasanikbacteria bacterium]|nr:hypothetical protein [Candidatus Magasanikbacteria bacterium]
MGERDDRPKTPPAGDASEAPELRFDDQTPPARPDYADAIANEHDAALLEARSGIRRFERDLGVVFGSLPEDQSRALAQELIRKIHAARKEGEAVAQQREVVAATTDDKPGAGIEINFPEEPTLVDRLPTPTAADESIDDD